MTEYIPSPRQFIAHTCQADELLYGGAAGGGKLSPLDSIVYTPFGPKLMGDIKVGDQVSNPDGTVARVIAVFPQGEKDIYRVTFDDGASCEVGLEHLWLVKEASKRRFRKVAVDEGRPEWRIATTEQIIEEIGKKRRLLIPLTEPVPFTQTSRFPDGRWPVPAYTLGAFLGDGSLGESIISLTTEDPYIVDRINDEGWGYTGINKKVNNRASSYLYPAELRARFKKLGLLGHRLWEKFIPEQYKVCSLDMRWALLQGLMDTDGYADSRGHASYCTVSEQLAKDVQWLARSLGFKANITSKIPTYTHNGEKKDGRLAYNVWIKGNSHEKLFSLPRKCERANQQFNGGFSSRTRKIVSIEFSRRAEAQCIKVNNPNGLYLSDDFVVTHNSEFLRQEALRTLTEFPGANVVYFRRRNSELEESVSRSRALCSPYGGRYTGGHLMQWKFPELVDPTTGRVSTWKFSHMNQEDDKYRHQSNEFDLIVFDEGSTFTRSMISFMRSRNRTPIPRSPARIRIGTNPGGISHVYFKDRFQIPDYEGAPREERPDLVSEVLYYWPIEESEALWNEITRYYDMRDRDQQDAAKVEWLKRRDEQGIFWRPYPDSIRYSKKTIDPYDIWRPMPESEDDRMPRTRCFIPAKIDDNPIYATDDSYRSSLATLGDETYVRALLHGDWSVFEGQFFKDWDQNIHVIDPIIPPGHWPTWGSMDWGMSDWGVFQWHTQDPDTEQIITYREYKFREKDIRSVARDIVGMTTDQETLLKVLADPAMFKRQGSTEVEAMIPKACREEGLILEPADNTRITGWATCRSLLAKNPSTGLPYWVATSNCSYLINTIPYLVHHENNVEDIARHSDDHPADCWRYGMSKRPSLGGAVRRTRVRPGRIRSGFMTRVG